MSLYSMMESKGTLTRPSIGRDSNQGVTQDFDNVIVANVICSVQPAGASIVALYAQRHINVNTTIYFGQNVGAQVNDIFVVIDREGTEHTFMVQGYKKNIFYRMWAPWQMDALEIN